MNRPEISILRHVLWGLLALWLAFPALSFAQKQDDAMALFKAGKYAEGLPLLEAATSKNPRNAQNQYLYGYSLYKLGRYAEAVKPLSIALKSREEARPQLADCFYRLYRFGEAADLLSKYDLGHRRRKMDAQEVERIERLKGRISRALRMLDNGEMVVVIDSVVVDSAAFLSAIDLSESAGSLSSAQRFLSALSASDAGGAYLNALKDRAMLSLRSADGGFDLNSLFRLGDKWVDLNPLAQVNTLDNENYPFVRQDGKTLFFARDGLGGLGGYDLYMTRLDDDGQYLQATPLGMPFNSPYNDYLIAYDEDKGVGFFASDRFQPRGRICVYTFILDESPAPVPSDDLSVKRAFASLYSIAATQDAGTDYAELRKKIRKQVATTAAVSSGREITFSVQGRNYSRWSDFRSSEARSLYTQAVSRERELHDMQTRIQRMRRLYHNASGTNRAALAKDILPLEAAIDRLRTQIDTLTANARKVESAAIMR